VDAGQIYIKDFIELNGVELHQELRKKQAFKTIELCTRFIKEYNHIKLVIQKGEETFYPRRTPNDSEIDIDKTIREQFNLLRIVNNEDYPAFFSIDGTRFKIAISKYEE
jgi:methionyl-tRNA formyltransferase